MTLLWICLGLVGVGLVAAGAQGLRKAKMRDYPYGPTVWTEDR